MSGETFDLEEIKHGDTHEKAHAIATAHFVRASISSNEAASKHESDRGFAIAKVLEERAALIAEAERQSSLLDDISTHADWLMKRGFACDRGVYSCVASEHSIGEKVAAIWKLANQAKGSHQ